MRIRCFSAALSLFIIAAMVTNLHSGEAAAKKALQEDDLIKLVDLQIDDATIIAKIESSGIAFPADNGALARIKKAGASDSVIAAVQKSAAQSKPVAVPGGAVTYGDITKLLQLGIKDDAILERLRKSPTLFVLDAAQRKELKQLGASERLVDAMQGQRSVQKTTAEISDLAYILDCSGSMGEKTREGQTKMEVAHKVIADLIRKTPEGLHVAFIVYGHNVEQGCKAVEIIRPLSELDSAGKEQLAQRIAKLQPVGYTPIALALEIAGKELAKNDTNCGIVLITDGMETCHGKPDEVAAQLAQNPKLSFGVNVIGFDVSAEERAGVEGIARAGKGTYYNADSATKFGEIVQDLHKQIEAKTAPAPAQRDKLGFEASGKNAKPGAFLNDAPVVDAGEYKGALEMMGAHYYQVAVRKGQELRAVGIVQKTPYQASNSNIHQTFSITVYDQGFQVVGRESAVVEGNPTTPNTVRATWTATADGVAYVGISASDNHDTSDIPVSLYGDLNPKPSPYTLRIKLTGEATGEAPRPLVRMEAKPGNGFGSAGELSAPGVAAADIKLGEVFFYRLPVKKGETFSAYAAVQKPWYRASNSRIKATYTLTAYDDDQVQVAQKKIEVEMNPADARTLSVTWTVELSGQAFIGIACENSGGAIYPDKFEPKPGRLAVQISPQEAPAKTN